MTPFTDPATITLGLWVKGLTDEEATHIFKTAATSHPTLKITDPDSCAENCLILLKDARGEKTNLNRLTKYYRDRLAQEYLRCHDGMMA